MIDEEKQPTTILPLFFSSPTRSTVHETTRGNITRSPYFFFPLPCGAEKSIITPPPFSFLHARFCSPPLCLCDHLAVCCPPTRRVKREWGFAEGDGSQGETHTRCEKNSSIYTFFCFPRLRARHHRRTHTALSHPPKSHAASAFAVHHVSGRRAGPPRCAPHRRGRRVQRRAPALGPRACRGPALRRSRGPRRLQRGLGEEEHQRTAGRVLPGELCVPGCGPLFFTSRTP